MICSRCVLDDKFPKIHFSEEGLCNYCSAVKPENNLRSYRIKLEDKFRQLVEKYKTSSTYDCLVAYSGGKDSTYTLQLLKEKYQVRILAYSYDNWFQSEVASENIKSVIKNLGIDHLTIRPNYPTFTKILKATIENDDLHPLKALERASAICTTCISLIRFAGLRIAIENEIPFLVFGLSPGQAPAATAVFKTNSAMVRVMQDGLFSSLLSSIGDTVRPYFLEERHFRKESAFPYSINPLAFCEYNEEAVLSVARSLGWSKPTDTDANSTNCLLNALANKHHIDRFGFNPYAYEMAELVRIGSLPREDALNRISEPPSEIQVAYALQEVGL